MDEPDVEPLRTFPTTDVVGTTSVQREIDRTVERQKLFAKQTADGSYVYGNEAKKLRSDGL